MRRRLSCSEVAGNPDTPDDFWTYTAIQGKAEAEGFYAAYPHGIEVENGDALDGPSWNSVGCCGGATADDKAFVLAIVEEVAALGCIDRKRVWASGLSAGGYFAGYLACVASETFSAVAIVAGLAGIDVTDKSQCPFSAGSRVLALHSTGDAEVSYPGGSPGCTTANPGSDMCKNSGEYMGIDPLLAVYATRQGCANKTEVVYTKGSGHDSAWKGTGSVTCKAHTNCPSSRAATLCTIEDDAHAWPGAAAIGGGEKGTDNLVANDAIFRFFSTGMISAGSIPNKGSAAQARTGSPIEPRICCRAMTPECLACTKGVTVAEYCKQNACPSSDPPSAQSANSVISISSGEHRPGLRMLAAAMAAALIVPLLV